MKTHVVDVTAEVEKDGLSKLGTIYAVVLTKLVVGDRCCVDINEHLLVFRPSFDNISAIGNEVVEGGQHL